MTLVTKSVNAVVDSVLARFLAAQSQVTDISPGSILRTLVEAISYEIGTNPSEILGFSMYDQVINVYNSGFIDLGEGICLDRVVSILGVTRTGAVPASSTVTFRRNSPLITDLLIPSGSLVSTTGDADTSAISFSTTTDTTFPTQILNERHTFSLSATPIATDYQYDFNEKNVNNIIEITGVYGGINVTFTQGVDYYLDENTDGTSRITWYQLQATPLVRNPDNQTDFFVNYIPLSKDVSVQAIEGGEFTNVGALTINTRVDVPLGIESVINYVSASGGQDIESDDSLRLRAKNQLSVLAKATIAALRFAILSVEGVNDVQIDDLPLTSVYNELHIYNTGDAYTTLNESPIGTVTMLEAQKSEIQNYNAGSNNVLTYTPATDLISIATNEATPTYFIKNVDYKLVSDEVEWIGATPAPGQSIVITYYVALLEGTDWEVNYDRKNIKWLSGVVPDNNTSIRIDYSYKTVGVATALILASTIPLTPAVRADVESEIEQTRAAGIQINITEPTVMTIDITLSLNLSAGAPTNAVEQVQDNITAYINSLSLGEDVIHSELIYQAQRVAGVYDVAVSIPGANVAVPIDRIARAGVITVNVV